MTDFLTLSYTSTSEIPSRLLSYVMPEKVLLWAEPPRIGYSKEYPPPPPWDKSNSNNNRQAKKIINIKIQLIVFFAMILDVLGDIVDITICYMLEEEMISTKML